MVKNRIHYLILATFIIVFASGSAEATSKTFKDYPDHTFNAREYIQGMSKGGHRLLVWQDPSVDLKKYHSVNITDFGGRLLPQQNVFSYDPYINSFNATFRSYVKVPQEKSSDALIIEGAIVECNPGSRAARYLVGFGAGRAAVAVVCEVYEPNKTQPCMRIYVRDTGSAGGFGGNSVPMLNHIVSQLAIRLGTFLNGRVGH